MKKYKVYVTDQRQPSYAIEQEILSKCDADLVLCNCKTDEDIIRECADADAILLDMAPMTAKAIKSLKKCKVISRYGVGVDNVDLKAAAECGIQVANVPDYCMEDVSDHALALLLSCLRNIPLRDKKVREGKWNISETGFRLQGKTLGLIGGGRIARALARKVSGFGLKEVIVCDPFLTAEQLKEYGMRKVEMEELLANSDFISLHLNLTDETRAIIDSKKLSQMKKTAILVNVSRGGLIDPDALVDALENNLIKCAGLDTHCIEPIPQDSPFLRLYNVILTDHAAYNTVEGVTELKTKAARNIVEALEGKPLTYAVKTVV